MFASPQALTLLRYETYGQARFQSQSNSGDQGRLPSRSNCKGPAGAAVCSHSSMMDKVTGAHQLPSRILDNSVEVRNQGNRLGSSAKSSGTIYRVRGKRNISSKANAGSSLHEARLDDLPCSAIPARDCAMNRPVVSGSVGSLTGKEKRIPHWSG